MKEDLRSMPASVAWSMILVIALFDQLTKAMIARCLPYGGEIVVVPGFFSVIHVHNTGAAFSMFYGNNIPFIILSLAVFIVLIFLRRRFDGWLLGTGWVLLLSGILGNVTDRIFRGHVIDFLDFQIRGHHWPAFNIADSCICIAAALFLLSGFVEKPKGKNLAEG